MFSESNVNSTVNDLSETAVLVRPAFIAKLSFVIMLMMFGGLFYLSIGTEMGRGSLPAILLGFLTAYSFYCALMGFSSSWIVSSTGIQERSLFRNNALRWEDVTDVLVSRGGDYHFRGRDGSNVEVARGDYLADEQAFRNALKDFSPELKFYKLEATLEIFFFVRHAMSMAIIYLVLTIAALAWWQSWHMVGAGIVAAFFFNGLAPVLQSLVKIYPRLKIPLFTFMYGGLFITSVCFTDYAENIIAVNGGDYYTLSLLFPVVFVMALVTATSEDRIKKLIKKMDEPVVFAKYSGF